MWPFTREPLSDSERMNEADHILREYGEKLRLLRIKNSNAEVYLYTRYRDLLMSKAGYDKDKADKATWRVTERANKIG